MVRAGAAIPLGFPPRMSCLDVGRNQHLAIPCDGLLGSESGGPHDARAPLPSCRASFRLRHGVAAGGGLRPTAQPATSPRRRSPAGRGRRARAAGGSTAAGRARRPIGGRPGSAHLPPCAWAWWAPLPAGICIGMEKGYFREQGIEIELTQFQAAQQMIPLLGAGRSTSGAVGSARPDQRGGARSPHPHRGGQGLHARGSAAGHRRAQGAGDR